MSNPRALPPFLKIWCTSPDDLEKRGQAEQSPLWKAYWQCLVAYRRTLTTNNPRYNEEKPTAAQLAVLAQSADLLKTLESEEDELKAAALHLQGLIQRSLRQDSLPTFERALALARLSPLSQAVVQAAIGTTLNQQDHHSQALEALEKARALLPRGELSALPPEDKQIMAALYSAIAYGYRKANQEGNENAEMAYQQASRLWPENNVIANNAAIRLSKISRLSALEQAFTILDRVYPAAKRDSLFVTPYYLADVCIKLSAFAEKGSADFAKYKERAEDCLAAAQAALANNKNYSANYIQKSKSRLAYLRSNLAMVAGNTQEAVQEQSLATSLREGVEERREKRDKFLDKFVKTDKPFDAYKLFRRPQFEQGVIVPMGVLMESVETNNFIGFLLKKAKENDTNFVLTPTLQQLCFTLSEQFNLGKLEPAEFETGLLTSLNLTKVVTTDPFWLEWNKMVKVGDPSEMGLAYHVQLLQKEKSKARIYLCSDTNRPHLRKIANECKDQNVSFDLARKPPTLAGFPLYASCETGKSRFELIQHAVRELKANDLRPSHSVTLILGNPDNIQNELHRAREKEKQKPLVAWCQENGVRIVYHSGQLEQTLEQAFNPAPQLAAKLAV